MSKLDKIDEVFDAIEQQHQPEHIDTEMPFVPIQNQKYVVMYYVCDDDNNQVIKIWGAFDSYEEAEKHIDIFKTKVGNDIFDSFIIEMYGLAVRPPQKNIKNQKYNERDVQDLMDTRDTQRKKINNTFDTREIQLDDEKEERERLVKELNGEEVKEPEIVEDYSHLLKKLEKPPTHFDPKDELTDAEKQECLKTAHKIVDEYYNDELNCRLDLSKENTRIPEQDWALVSFTGKNCNQKTDVDGIIIWGVFSSINDVKKHAPLLSSSKLDLHVLELYTWIAVPPSEKFMSSQELHDAHILSILSNYKKNVQYAKQLFEYRKNKLLNNPDMNQFYKNKSVHNELKSMFNNNITESIVEENGIQNEEVFRKVFKNQKRLPRFEIIQEDIEK